MDNPASPDYEPRHRHDPWAWLRDLQMQGRCLRVEWHDDRSTVPVPPDPEVMYFIATTPPYRPAHAEV